MAVCLTYGNSKRTMKVLFASVALITVYELVNHMALVGSMRTYPSTSSISTPDSYSHSLGTSNNHHPERNTSCTTAIRPTSDRIIRVNQFWQVHNEENIGYIVYSAFYDNREANDGVAYLRVLGLIRDAGQKKGFCQIWYGNDTLPHITEITAHQSGRGDHFAGSKYSQVLISCQLPSEHPVPTHVSLTLNPCTNSTIFLPVYYSKSKGYKHDFAVCVAISHDTARTKDIIEWTEINKMFGVGAIHIYNGTLTSDLIPVFDYYQKEGVMYVHSMPPPVKLGGKKGAKFASPASLNDCMMRYMYDYHYVIVIDFDEVIVPNSSDNYTSLLKEIDAQDKHRDAWKSYTFMNTLFLHDFEPDNQHSGELNMLRYRIHAKPGGPGWGSKSFIDPRTCLSVTNHYCYIQFPNAQKPFTINVNPSIAKLHHYKLCNFGKVKCEELMKDVSEDTVLLKYKEYILHKVMEARDNISKGARLTAQ